jgi:flagellar motor switch protein FliM
VWDIAAAVAAVEVALGTTEVKDAKPRKLSTVEKTMLKRLLGTVVQKLGPLVALEPKNLRVIDIVEELGSWRDGGALADAQRLSVHLAVHGPGGDSLMRLYLPGFAPDKGAKRPELPKHAPEHLASVPFEVSARLGSAEIPLSDLLGLEVGDVIPLGAPADEPLRLMIEDRVCAEATLGSKDGNLAVRIAFLRPPGRED